LQLTNIQSTNPFDLSWRRR